MKNTSSIIDTVCSVILFYVRPLFLFSVKKYLLIGSLLFVSVAANAGFVVKNKKLEVSKENFSFYLFNQKPDKAVAYLLESINSDSMSNRLKLDRELKRNNILFFRCYYNNSNGTVYKYVDISVKGIPLKELAVIDVITKTVEVQQFFQSGDLLSRTQYSMSLDKVEGDKAKYDTAWYLDNPRLLKNGRQEMYHKNGALRFERSWNNGQIKDTTYTEYYSNGKTKLRVSFKDGELLKRIKFDAGGKPVTNNKGNEHKKAFLFGLDKYKPTKDEEAILNRSTWMDLNSCLNDISLLKKTLMLYQGFKEENIFIVSDNNATKLEVTENISQFIKTVNKGDVAYIHFSGHAGKMPSISKPGQFELAIPCRDSYKDTAFTSKGHLMQAELESFLNNVKNKLGVSGQLILSLDVSHSGLLLNNSTTEVKEELTIAARGESNKLLYDLIKEPGAPAIIFTATTGNQFGYETRVGDTAYGAFTYAFCKELANPLIVDPTDVFEGLTGLLKQQNKSQKPQLFTPENQVMFENPEEAAVSNGMATLPAVSANGNAFILSIGVSDYPKNNLNLRFNNSDDDAATYSEFFAKQFDYFKDNKSKLIVQSVLLQNNQATKEKIIDGINRAIAETKPDDYFVFNFSGYCKPLKDSSGKQVTYFIPYGLNNITDSAEILKNGIALKQLKDLFQLIPANNQLFITEAGSTEDFQKEFIQALIETSPTIASLSNKNRIFLVPKNSGLDNFSCQNVTIEHGPINYYLTNLNPDLNIYGVFNGGIYADAVKFALNKTEVNCQFFRTGYFDIFFEKDFVKDLKYYLPDEVMQTRGNELLKKDKMVISSSISNRYALVIGTDNYLGKPTWKDLANPILDATDITKELRDVYGFNVKQLNNPTADSVYYQILNYATLLKPTDQLIIYFAGHGDFDDQLFDDGFIVCHNSMPSSQDPYRNSYIQYSKLSRMINKLPAQQVLMILDVCFGGTFDERVARNEARSKTDEYKDLGSESFFSEKMKKKTRLYISSGGKKEVPDGYKGKHSPFALRLLEALQTKGGTSKILTGSDLFQYVKKLPSGPLLGSFGDDMPGSEFVLLAK